MPVRNVAPRCPALRPASRRWPSIVASALVLVATAWAPLRAEVPEDLASLVPNESAALLYVPSPAALEADVREIVGSVSQEKADRMSFGELVGQMLGPAAESWDVTKPMAVAALPPAAGGGFAPRVTVILPSSDTDATLRALGVEPGTESPTATARGAYVAFAMMPGPTGAAGSAPILAEIPDVDVLIRLDVDRLYASYGMFLEMMVPAMQDSLESSAGEEGETAVAMSSELMDQALSALRAARRLDITVDVNRDESRVGYALSVAEDSEVARGPDDPERVARIASRLAGDLPAFAWFAGALDSWMVPWQSDLAESLEDERAARYLAASQELYEGLGPWAGAMGAGEDEVWLSGVAEPTLERAEMERLIDEIFASEIFADAAGVTITDEGESEVEGVTLRGVRVAVDFEELAAVEAASDTVAAETETEPESAPEWLEDLFADGFRLRHGWVGDHLVFGMGGDETMAATIRAARAGDGAPEALARAIDRSPLPPNCVAAADLRELIAQLAMLADDPGSVDVPAGDPVPVAIWNGHLGTRYAGTLAMDAAGVAELVTWLERVAKNGEQHDEMNGE